MSPTSATQLVPRVAAEFRRRRQAAARRRAPSRPNRRHTAAAAVARRGSGVTPKTSQLAPTTHDRARSDTTMVDFILTEQQQDPG